MINEIDVEVYNKKQLLHALSLLDLNTVGTITLVRKNGKKTIYRFDYRADKLNFKLNKSIASARTYGGFYSKDEEKKEEALRAAVQERVKIIKRNVRQLPSSYFT